MPVYHSGSLSKTDRPDYIYPLRPQTADLTKPLAPRNLMVTSPYDVGKIDIRWDNPKIIAQNSGLNILGVNVYRATDSGYGPYVKINDAPIGVLFYRDETKEELVIDEDATATLRPANNPDGRWLIYSRYKPIVMPNTNGQTSDRAQDVRVEIDSGDGSFIEVPAFQLSGRPGEIQLIDKPVYNYDVNQIIPPRLPWPPTGRVRITYRYLKHQVLTVLNQRIYYKVTTMAVDPNDSSKTIETPLDEISARSSFDIEQIDYIYREMIRRNGWILEQGGERVKLFTRKWMGIKCETYENSYGQSHNDCSICYGTNIVGGFEGPFDLVIAPPETEKSIELADMGLHIRYDWQTWIGDFPLLNERDIIVRQNNERYIVGPVNPQGARGAILQQHFTISYKDQGDIAYRIPISGGETSVPASYDPYREAQPTPASPAINNKPGIPADKIIRGKTVTFENISFIFLMSLLTGSIILNNIMFSGLLKI